VCGASLASGESAEIGVQEGDEVIFGKYSGTEIKVDGEEIKILRETDILAEGRQVSARTPHAPRGGPSAAGFRTVRVAHPARR
jgi:hypothetical protein